ncbi:hypothetical protein E5A73_20055 [Sphingomonas gei]|uniref:Uncharacterized protein n=1 Tax=Sphingomonas gei TaxID=1395960 RepID=A0A4S1X2B3_9SPHN|nr:hypothetical protein [Sphingomonas gei]TGX49137.1 hypothetical protein E5A73_20055 [Sphingomonas gei]
MQVIVLVIVEPDTESITIHESRESALAALRSFIDARWLKRFGVAFPQAEASTDDLARQYFSAASGTFIIGEASLSEIESLYDSDRLP